jgi:preprotein translocase subunit SecG
MTALSIILNIVLILVSIVLVAVVLMQQGQRQGLGAIAGGAETFFGKGKAKGMDAKLAKITKIAAIIFIVAAIACTIVVSHIDNGAEVVVPETVVETVETETAETTEAVEETTEEAAAE